MARSIIEQVDIMTKDLEAPTRLNRETVDRQIERGPAGLNAVTP